MNFLGCRAEDFFSLPEIPLEPFGRGPWPCLNRAADHFGQLRVTKCDITRTQKKDGSPAGYFHCDCGFVYYRLGPDHSPEDRYQFSRVISYGDVWYSAVVRMRESKGLTPKEIAQQLGATHFIIKNQFAWLGSVRLHGKATTQRESSAKKRGIEVNSAILETYRNHWLKTIRENPGAGRSELRKKAGGEYIWLLRHDREWFEANTPQRMKSLGPPKLTDWEKRDAELAAEARAAAARIMSAPGRPVRASRTAIARDIGVLETIYKRGHLLPLTIKALAEVAETAESYAIRRIWWAVECYREEKVRPAAGQLQMRAAVRTQMLRKPEVSEAYDKARKSLRKSEMDELLKAS